MGGIIFTDSAFRHGVPESDFVEAMQRRHLKFRIGRGGQAVYEIIGRNAAGQYRHFLYRALLDGTLKVFHMMPAKETQKRLYRRRFRL